MFITSVLQLQSRHLGHLPGSPTHHSNRNMVGKYSIGIQQTNELIGLGPNPDLLNENPGILGHWFIKTDNLLCMSQIAPLPSASQNNLTHLTLKIDPFFSYIWRPICFRLEDWTKGKVWIKEDFFIIFI